jgi:hypothetical protein
MNQTPKAVEALPELPWHAQVIQKIFFPDGRVSYATLQRTNVISYAESVACINWLHSQGFLAGLEVNEGVLASWQAEREARGMKHPECFNCGRRADPWCGCPNGRAAADTERNNLETGE